MLKKICRRSVRITYLYRALIILFDLVDGPFSGMTGGRPLFVPDEELFNQVVRVFCRRVCIQFAFVISAATVTALFLNLLLMMLVDDYGFGKVSPGGISARKHYGRRCRLLLGDYLSWSDGRLHRERAGVRQGALRLVGRGPSSKSTEQLCTGEPFLAMQVHWRQRHHLR